MVLTLLQREEGRLSTWRRKVARETVYPLHKSIIRDCCLDTFIKNEWRSNKRLWIGSFCFVFLTLFPFIKLTRSLAMLGHICRPKTFRFLSKIRNPTSVPHWGTVTDKDGVAVGPRKPNYVTAGRLIK